MPEPLSLTGKRWILRRADSPGLSIVDVLKRERGILDIPKKLSNPFLFPEMEKAVRRIERAIEKKETIGIFGDYDADGITGTAQLIRFFRRRGIEPVIHLPDRAKEGYGMKKTSVDTLHAKGVTLVITVDTGIAAHEEIAYAKSLGIDVIVTDHHRPSPRSGEASAGRPLAYAVIHPLVPSEFPNKHLSGSGVAFTLVRALEHLEQWDGIDLDIALATIGTIGDLVPLTGENRVLVMHGLKFLSKLPDSPLKDLVDDIRGTGPLTSGDIAFRLVPRINAAGRMAHPLVALTAILEGGAAIEELHRLNGDRQSLVEELHDVIVPLVNLSDAFLVVASDRMTPGTAGLLSSRLTECFGRPSLVAATVGDCAVASIRSVDGIDVVECLEHPSVRALLLTFGGHAQAAGCTFLTANTQRLRLALNAVLAEKGIYAVSMVPSLHLDAELHYQHIDLRLVRSLQELSPFGEGNDEPLFLLSSQSLSDLRVVGSDKSHLQAKISGIKSIGFRLGSLMDQIREDTPMDIACRIGLDTWNGREAAQIFIEDIR